MKGLAMRTLPSMLAHLESRQNPVLGCGLCLHGKPAPAAKACRELTSIWIEEKGAVVTDDGHVDTIVQCYDGDGCRHVCGRESSRAVVYVGPRRERRPG